MQLQIKRPILFTLLASSLVSIGTLAADQPRPKYGPQATRLVNSRDYVKKNDAPDFWALMPYYVPQQDGRSCSVASVTMVLNAARASKELTASDELVTQKSALEKTKNDTWSKGVGPTGRGVTLEQLGKIVESSFKAHGFANVKVTVVHAESGSEAFKSKLHDALTANEKSANDFIIANFLQSEYTGDPEGGGHISPIAAYDAKSRRALVFDSDRQYYEPYWVSEETLAKGMATRDSDSGKNRGFVWVQFN